MNHLCFSGGLANERTCGRPLGMRVKNGFIYVVDAYFGLFKINIKTGKLNFKCHLYISDLIISQNSVNNSSSVNS